MTKKTTQTTEVKVETKEALFVKQNFRGPAKTFLREVSFSEREDAHTRLQDACVSCLVDVAEEIKREDNEKQEMISALVKEISASAEAGDFLIVQDKTFRLQELLAQHVSGPLSVADNKFIAKDNFVLNVSDDVIAKISYLGDNFKDWFLGGEGKIEEKSDSVLLRHFDLEKPMLDNAIIKKLGGKEKAVVTLSDVYAMMAKQSNGENGKLFTNGYANIFYVYDQSGVLRAVRVSWRGDGWGVYAGLAPDLGEWKAGYRAFSRNS